MRVCGVVCIINSDSDVPLKHVHICRPGMQQHRIILLLLNIGYCLKIKLLLM